jgi:thiol:disulfide interchange protein DsbD
MIRKMFFFVLTVIMISITFAGQGDQPFDSQADILQARLILPAEALMKQQSFYLLVEVAIMEGWHINSNEPLEDYLIATEIQFADVEGITFGKVRYIEPELKKFLFSNTKMSVYEGKIFGLTTITVSPEFRETELKISGMVYYQACNDESCLAPNSYPFEILTPVLERGMPGTEINKEIFKSILPRFQTEIREDDDNQFSRVIRESSLLYTFIFIFLGGLALNLTPCVYPLIPITISYFGGQSEGSKKGLVLRAITYVLGMSITYSVLGVLASLTGDLLGSALQNPLVLIFVALVLVGLALSMFGLYEIRVPQSLALLGGKSRAGYIGTLFMGLTVGLIAAPCIGPFVLGLLTYVGDLGDPIIGFWMFFVLAMGLGTPFLVLGIFSGAASRLPRSGAWMVWVRNIFGFVLIGMAVYFLEPLFPSEQLYFYTLAVLSLAAGIYLGWLDKNKGSKSFNLTKYIIGLVFILLAVFFVLPAESESAEKISWQPYSPEELQRAREMEKPVIIDFYADWCIPCKEMDIITFSDEQVITQAKNFVTIKADLTHYESEQTNSLREKYKIKGVPTIVFLTADGAELNIIRLVEFEEANQFLQRMRTALSGRNLDEKR